MKKNLFVFLLLFLISALAYLPRIGQFGYFRDDWYLMYSANTLGGDVFHQIYAEDRPIRAFVMSSAYSLFGLNPIYYNVSAYLFRLFGAFVFYLILQMIWKEATKTNLIATILFLIFPGFISTPNAIDYQAQQLSLFLAQISIALGLYAIFEQKISIKIFAILLTSITSFVYLGLVEYFLGLEVFRIAVIFLFSYRESALSFFQKIRQALLNSSYVSAGAVLFVLWRFFIFDSERKATDLGAQLNIWLQSPLLMSVEWLKILIKDIAEILLLAWWVPLSDLWDISLRLRDVFFASSISILVVICVVLIFKNKQIENTSANSNTWFTEVFFVGLVTVIAGFIPVILSNRNADFYALSRYMLASSVGAVILVSAFLYQIRLQKVYTIATCVLILSSVLTHHLNGLAWVRSSNEVQNFWWQVSWRIPQLKEDTTLVVNYPTVAIEEDYFIWGPANFIYYPQSKNTQRVEPVLWGAVLNRESSVSILNQADPLFLNRRSIITYLGYNNILLLTQPSSSSCMQVIDGNIPIVSENEQLDIQMIASESNQNNVILDKTHAPLSTLIFGSEPKHEWCFYYQTASLAFQHGEFEQVLEIKRTAEEEGFVAQDPVEWMPFLKSAILLNDYDEVAELARYIKKSSFLKLQACENLPKLQNLDPQMLEFIENTFCIN